MRAIRWGCMAVAACALAAGCKSVSLAPGAEQVRTTEEAADVAGCASLGKIEAASSMLTDPDAERQLRNRTVALGGNVLLFASPVHRSGTIYACGEAAAAAARTPVAPAAAAPSAAAPAAAATGAAAAAAPAPVQASPAQIVQRQVDAYNERDLERFLGFYAEDAKIIDYPDQPFAAGKDAIRDAYRKLFERSPQVNASVLNRIADGRFVIDQERVTGLADGKTLEAVVVYEVKDGRIARVTLLRR
jgi:uncharacterized protein (TIGR02246 family)